jgi:hypothetical protein
VSADRARRHQLARLRGLLDRPSTVDDDTLARLDRATTSVELRVDEYVGPDDYRGPVFVAIAHGRRLAIVTPTNSHLAELDDLASARILAAARGVVAAGAGKPDAKATTITRIRLRLDDARGTHCCEAAVDAELPAPWSKLLCAMFDRAAGRAAEITSSASATSASP